MEIKLFSFLNLITNKKAYKYIIIALLLSCLMVFGRIKDGKTNYSILFFLACFVSLCVAVSFLFPSSILIRDNEIKYVQFQYTRRVHGNNFSGTSVNIGGNKLKFSFAYVEYKVTDIEAFDLCQTKLEKALNIGHVEFRGKTRFYAKKDMEYISEREIHIIYGICNFKKFKEMNASHPLEKIIS